MTYRSRRHVATYVRTAHVPAVHTRCAVFAPGDADAAVCTVGETLWWVWCWRWRRLTRGELGGMSGGEGGEEGECEEEGLGHGGVEFGAYIP